MTGAPSNAGQHLLLTSEPRGDARPGGNLYSVRLDGTELQQLTQSISLHRRSDG